MNAFSQAFGPKAQAKGVIEGEKLKSSPQEDMMFRMIKMLMPDFDPKVITELGTKVEMMVTHYNQELAIIRAQQDEILRLIKRNMDDGR
jgi:hypothetical protein